MNIIDIIPFLYAKYYLFVLVFTRISALFSTFFIFKSQLVSPRITIAISAILSFYVLMLYNQEAPVFDLLSMMTIKIIIEQFFIGFIAGLILNIVFEIVSIAGQLISTQTGLAMAAVIDPIFGSITQLTHFYTFSFVLVFFMINGHLLLIKMILDSFLVLPIGHALIQQDILADILRYSSVLFAGGVSLSIAIIVAITITNLALAMMTRFAPQFNVFSIGINLTLILGLLCVYLFFGLFIERSDYLINNGFEFINHLFHVMK